MLTHNALAQLERSLRATRVLSVYLDRTAHDPASRDLWRQQLDQLVIHAREGLSGSHAEQAGFERCVDRLYQHLGSDEMAPRSPGWVGLFPMTGEPYVAAVPVQMPTLVAWEEGARIAPFIRALKQHIPAIVAIATSREARIYIYAGGTIEAAGTIYEPRRSSAFDHMGDPPHGRFHQGTHGAPGTEVGAAKDLAATEAMVRELSGELETLAGSRAWILIDGSPDVAAEVLAALPERLRRRAHRLRGVDVHSTEAELRDAAEHVATAASRERDLELVLELLDREAAGGRGVSGRVGTLEALHEHAVDRLFITGKFIREHAGDAEALVRLAFEQRADLEYVSAAAAARLDDAGGVGALLRFVPARGQPAPAELAGAGR